MVLHSFLILVAASTLLLFNFNYDGRSSKKAPSVHLSPINYQYLHFGYKALLADALWLRILPDIDTYILRSSEKKHTWQYEMIDIITTLAPKFRAPYRSGGDVLSVVLDDREGATKIFEKGILQFPTYWPLLYSAAYHHMEEEKNPKRAAELLLAAHQNGGPEWFVSLAGKLYSEAGQKELAIRSLIDFIKRAEDGVGRTRAISRLKEFGVDTAEFEN
jgi:hypothetical protein